MTSLLRRTGGPSPRAGTEHPDPGHPRTETVALPDALGRRLAQTLHAPASLPRFDDSQMDGYAVRAAETPGTLDITAPVAAGRVPEALPPGCAAPVMTGAPIPAGADAVIPVEATSTRNFADTSSTDTSNTDTGSTDSAAAPQRVLVPATSPGAFLRRRGSDVVHGEEVLAAGAVLTAAGVGLLAAFGLTEVDVLRRPRALVIVGGDEVLAPGRDLPPGKVYDANGSLLAGWAASRGLEVLAVRLIDDDVADFVERLRADLSDTRPELIITSGGISAGRYEVMRQGFAVMDEITFDIGTVAMQPGGPQGLGIAALPGGGEAAVICLPGNPVSTWVSCEVMLADALAEAWGLNQPQPWVPAQLAWPVQPLAEKDQLRRGTLQHTPAGIIAAPMTGTSSHLLAAAATAEALIRVPAGAQELPAGATVTVRRL